MSQILTLTDKWDKTFPKSNKVNHSKVTFYNRYGITVSWKGTMQPLKNGNSIQTDSRETNNKKV